MFLKGPAGSSAGFLSSYVYPANASFWDSKDYAQEYVARGQIRNVITSGNDRYIAAIVGWLRLNKVPWDRGSNMNGLLKRYTFFLK